MSDPIHLISEVEARMKKAIEATKKDFVGLRTGRASTALVEGIKVEYYGTLTPMNQVANISAPDARTLEIKPWDSQTLSDIERAIQKSDLGLTPNNDGKLIRISIPPLTEERRKEMTKVVKQYAEAGRVALRAIRQDANKSADGFKKEKTLSEDDVRKLVDRVQKTTDHFAQEINQLAEHKEKEIMEI